MITAQVAVDNEKYFGTFLKKIAVVITSRIGGTSGPTWGTGFLRAGATAGTVASL